MNQRQSHHPQRKRRGHSSPDDSMPATPVDYEDAHPDTDEIPLSDLDEFIVTGSDDKGRKVTVSFNIHPMLDREVDVILLAKRFPYANRKEVFRHAILRHLAWLLQIRPTVPRHHMSMFEAGMEVCRDDETSMRMEHVFQRLHEQVNTHVERGEHDEARRLISTINQKLRDMPTSAWVRRFRERFGSQYGNWIGLKDEKDKQDEGGE